VAFRARKQRVPGAVQGRDRQPVVSDLRQELSSRIIAFQHAVKLYVRCRRPIATSELQTLDSEICGRLEHRVEAQIRQAVSEHSDLHATRFGGS